MPTLPEHEAPISRLVSHNDGVGKPSKKMRLPRLPLSTQERRGVLRGEQEHDRRLMEFADKILAPLCDYCGNKSQLVLGPVIYPHRTDLSHRVFYHCAPCYAYVGCHPNTVTPLGTPANASLRDLRRMVHAKFDPLWKSNSSTLSRHSAYVHLANKLNIPLGECHIGMFTETLCHQALKALL